MNLYLEDLEDFEVTLRLSLPKYYKKNYNRFATGIREMFSEENIPYVAVLSIQRLDDGKEFLN